MSKYFRTENAIKQVGHEVCISVERFEELEKEGKVGDPVIKVADTIEELCDVIVVWYADGYINQFKANNTENLRFYKEYPSGKKVYGAIWTNKGLIYVAKMNEKGELELL